MGQNGVFWPTLTAVNKIGRHGFYCSFDVPKEYFVKKKKLKNLKIFDHQPKPFWNKFPKVK